MTRSIRMTALATEERRTPPPGRDERLAGYGVLGLPFASGHYLALRRFPANPFGTPYSSVWHRDPAGRWTFYSDREAEHSCPRFFDAAIDRAFRTPVALDWTGDRRLEVTAGPIRWTLRLAITPATALMSAMSRLTPPSWWEADGVLAVMGRMAGPMLGAGRIRLTGTVPNGQWFRAAPRAVFAIRSACATLDGADLGPLGPLPVQTRLGGFWLPQRGLFMIGESCFEAFDPARHRAARPAVGGGTEDPGPVIRAGGMRVSPDAAGRAGPRS
ncbi:MAG: hypothetical protein ACTHJL_06840 [Amnibacterium sp.]